jgi:hypothetical protein
MESMYIGILPDVRTKKKTNVTVRVYLLGYILCIIDYHICRDIFDKLHILYNRLSYMLGYIW